MDTNGLSTKASRIGIGGTLADHLSSKTHFTSDECKALLTMFDNMAPSGKMDRMGLRDFMTGSFDITDDIMLDFVYRAFDQNTEGGVDETEFITGLSRILRGSMEEQIDFCYTCFDVNGDGALAREELYLCLRGCIHPGYGLDLEEIDDAEKDIVDMLMKKLDVNGDGLVTKDDFNLAVHAEPLLMQGIGPCLPDPNAMSAFLSTFTEDYRSYSAAWNPSTLIRQYSKLPDTMGSLGMDDTERLQHKISRLQHRDFYAKYLGPQRSAVSAPPNLITVKSRNT